MGILPKLQFHSPNVQCLYPTRSERGKNPKVGSAHLPFGGFKFPSLVRRKMRQGSVKCH